MFCNFVVCFWPGARIAWLVGGGRNKFWGGTRSLFMWIREGHGGTRNLSQSESNEQDEDQTFIGISRLKSEIQTFFPAENRWSPKNKGLHPKNVMKSTKITKILVANTKLGLDLHSSSPEPVNFLRGHSPRLKGGHNFRLGGTSSRMGGTAPECPPVSPGLVCFISLVQ